MSHTKTTQTLDSPYLAMMDNPHWVKDWWYRWTVHLHEERVETWRAVSRLRRGRSGLEEPLAVEGEHGVPGVHLQLQNEVLSLQPIWTRSWTLSWLSEMEHRTKKPHLLLLLLQSKVVTTECKSTEVTVEDEGVLSILYNQQFVNI